MEEQVPLSKMSDLQLARVQGQLYNQFMQVKDSIIAINQELEKRTPKVEVVVSDTTA